MKYIVDADALKHEINRRVYWRMTATMDGSYDYTMLSEKEICELIDKMQTEESQFEITNEDIQNAIKEGFANGYEMAKAKFEPKKGKWRVYEGTITCEECGKEADEITPFCAWCGADMRGKEE